MTMLEWLNTRMFNLVHRHNLVYNTCWEDPRLDRVALGLGPQDRVLVITSAGCNTLDYVLEGPAAIHAVDMNPRQNALLELKIAGIRALEFEPFFQMFGEGRLPGARDTYRHKLRGLLSPWSRTYWDRHIGFFDSSRRPFYFRGTSGGFARLLNFYIDRVIRARPWCDALLAAESIHEQREIYEQHLRPRFWTRPLRFAMSRNTTLSLVGVPRPQRQQVERHYEGGIIRFIEDCLEAVFAELPIADNYFWRVYMKGKYTRDCCPEYLKPQNFAQLQRGLIDRVHVHTNSVEGFLTAHEGQISRFVLLDHMDWLSTHFFPLLETEWQAILNRAAPNARFIWRSGGLRTDFVHEVQVRFQQGKTKLKEVLQYDERLAAELHPRDRVHTYGSFYIARLAA